MELVEELNRKKDSHKGENGKIGLIGGSKDYTGAPALSAKAALRTGSDLVKILTSEKIKDVVAGYSENFILEGYNGSYLNEKSMKKAKKLEKWSDVMVIGPGIGDIKQKPLKEFIESSEIPKVIDAEAIEIAVKANVSNAVLTPHEEEAEIIRKEYGSIKNFVEQRENIVVVEKSETDRIFTKGEVYENKTGHPTMTVGGTGDVLAGVIGSLMGQNMKKEEAARLGTWLNGKSGEKAAEKYGNGALATDIIEYIPSSLMK